MKNLIYLAVLLALILVASCGDSKSTHSEHELPIIGERNIVEGDTVYHTVGDWAFYRQDSALVTEDMLQGTPYVVDFFFTSCPTICPRVTHNMLRIHERFIGKTPLKLVSFTVDPKRDSVKHLANYANNLSITSANDWWFLTGDKLELYGIADDYFSVAIEDEDVPGGFDHSGRILLVDGKGHVRAYADGTDDEEVNHFMDDIAIFLNNNPTGVSVKTGNTPQAALPDRPKTSGDKG